MNSAYTVGNADDAILEFLNCIHSNDTSTATYKTTLMREVCPAINEIRDDPGKEAEYMTWQTKLMDVEYKSRVEERIEVARNLLKLNLPLDQIATATGLTYNEVA